MLRGRRTECLALDLLVEGARAGHSGVLVVRGEAGVGKSALLDYAQERAPGCRVARLSGIESEMELPFAGLQQLCWPLLEGLERLPRPQRDALGTVFGLRSGGAPDALLVGLATLGLLAEAARRRPLVSLVDDAHWLDRASAQALAFVARRLQAESVAMVFATRERTAELAGLPELVLHGLRDGDARALLASVVSGRLDDAMRERIVAETGGNPLALLELPRGFTAAELAGGFGLLDALPLSGRIEESYLRRLERLPADTRLLLLVAAAEPLGEPLLLHRAAQQLGIGGSAAAAAEAEELFHVGARVRFRHPLVRSATYRSAAAEERRRVHAALAEATDPELDPDRRAWHRAQAAAGPDEAVAEELARSAGRAQERGGLAGAAALLERATALTPDRARRSERALLAAQAGYAAGAPDVALGLLATAEAGPLGELQRAQVERLRAMIAFTVARGPEAPGLLLSAARRLEPLDIRLARDTYLEALATASFLGRFGSRDGLLEAARAALAAPPAPGSPRAVDLLLDGLATRFSGRHEAAAPLLERALREAREASERGDGADLSLWLAARVASDLWDDEAMHALATRQVEVAREAGALTVLPIALYFRAAAHVLAGELAAAAALVEEGDAITAATGNASMSYTAMILSAWQGDEARTSSLLRHCVEDASAREDGMAITTAEAAAAVLYNGLGRYDDALEPARAASEHEELGIVSWARPELVEAAVRSGRHDLAEPAFERLRAQTRASGTEWALGTEARCRALLTDGREAEAHYREAIDRLGRTRAAAYLARARLLYGEWLRRERRRLDAREELRRAHDDFASMGAEAFAERAARELAATGERARRRAPDTVDRLTPQEAQIAGLAVEGLSNAQIGAQLYISPRTVEYHLKKVFRKRGLTSRGQLADALASDAGEPRGLD